ncbi:MAG: glutathione S-transferase N-terminal domain-containing protein [Rhodospirillales bacterium]|nr:glutathione S-transferase N-terminal domain-containing protein [Rhodospirillales bacterium]
MKMRYSTTSPFARKCLVVAMEAGVDKRLELIKGEPTADAGVCTENPLGKLPALTLENGEVLFDSPVIAEYLDNLHEGPRLFPSLEAARWKALRRQALADGIADAAIAIRMERTLRPAGQQSETILARHRNAILRGLAALEHEPMGDGFNIGHIAAICTLDYVQFRLPDLDWRTGHPRLAAWHDTMAKRPSLAATLPHD